MQKMSQFGVLLILPGIALMQAGSYSDRSLYFYAGLISLGFMFGWLLAIGIISYWLQKESSRNALVKAEKGIIDFLITNKSKAK